MTPISPLRCHFKAPVFQGGSSGGIEVEFPLNYVFSDRGDHGLSTIPTDISVAYGSRFVSEDTVSQVVPTAVTEVHIPLLIM